MGAKHGNGTLLIEMLFIGLGTLGAWAEPPLTFDDRVRAQEAIERVYYNHRIWPKENPGPKPPFEQMISRAQIEAKVEDYLKKSVGLEKFWQRPITAEQLQAEMDRMAKQTKDPETLRQLFAALDNDPYLIAECLARPILADRLIRNWYAKDERFHGETRKQAVEALEAWTMGNFYAPEGAQYHKVTYQLENEFESGETRPDEMEAGIIFLSQQEFEERWKESPAEGELSNIQETLEAFVILHTLCKTEGEIELESLSVSKSPIEMWLENQTLGLAFTDEAESDFVLSLPLIPEISCVEGWDNGILNDMPDARLGHTAVWTGSEMIVWGGNYFNTGGRYNPSTDSWIPTSIGANVPAGRQLHTVVWTGTEMIIWGGYFCSGDTYYLNTGGRYNPTTDSWIPTSIGVNVPSPRCLNTAIWTGNEMIVWGGYFSNGSAQYLKTGGRYNPATDSWIPTSTGATVPSSRYDHTAVWTGAEMIIWGGEYCYPYDCYFLKTGGRYNPTTDSWIATSTGENVPKERSNHTAAWTGTEMIVWGGAGGSNTGGRYNPSTDSWVPTSIGLSTPTERFLHTAVWTGVEMIVWGGYNGSYIGTGARYNPAIDFWFRTSIAANVPSPRANHTAVWTGTEMIIWGGGNGLCLNTGGKYNPSANSWVPTSIGANAPLMRASHSAVWTGSEMIVWGGCYDDMRLYYLNSGGQYDPATDSWTSTSSGFNMASARSAHSAIWAGSEMIIWGGYDYKGVLNTGGRYNPTTDSWIATSIGENVPVERSNHTAVWTGSEMIVWGGSNFDDFNTGGRYNPTSDSWIATSTGENAPVGRTHHTAVWTGTEMIIWGGYHFGDDTYYLNTGGRYNPSTDSWIPTFTGADAPLGRYYHTVVWTGSEMIVWGGYGDGPQNTGGRYNPISDSWIGTSTAANCPSVRGDHAAVWTGMAMIVWGGAGYGYLSTGGQYNPVLDTWIATPMTGAVPTGRVSYTAVWTGVNLIVWGGYTGGSYLNSGGRYTPVPMPIISGPDPACKEGLLTTQIFYSYQWYRNGILIDGATAQTYNVVAPGTYTVRVTDTHGCSATSFGFYISPYPATPIIFGPEIGCGPLPLSTGAYYSYQWNINGSPIPGATAQNHPAVQSGVYTVRVGNASGCTAVSADKAVTVWGAAVIEGGHFNTCPDTTVILSTLDAYTSYQWNYFGIPIPGATDAAHAVTVTGDYSVTTTDGHGCVQTTNPYPVFIDFCPGSEVSPRNGIFPLRINKSAESSTGYYIHFQRLDTLDGYNIYEGAIGAWYSHADAPGNDCAAVVADLGGGVMWAELNPSAGDHYYLVTAFGGLDEGPSGFDSSGTEIPASQSTCAP